MGNHSLTETETMSTSPLGFSMRSDSCNGTSYIVEGIPDRAFNTSPDEFTGKTAMGIPKQLVQAHASISVDLEPKNAPMPEIVLAMANEPRVSSFKMFPPSNRNMKRGASGAPLGYQR